MIVRIPSWNVDVTAGTVRSLSPSREGENLEVFCIFDSSR